MVFEAASSLFAFSPSASWSPCAERVFFSCSGLTQAALTINSLLTGGYVDVQRRNNTNMHKCTLTDTQAYTHTPAALPQQPLLLMDGRLITTLTLGLFSPRSSPRTGVRVSTGVSVCVWVCV